MKYYHLIVNCVLTIIYFITSQTLGSESDITLTMMKIADALVEISETVNDEIHPTYYDNLTSTLETLNDIVFSDIQSDNINKYKEFVDGNFSKMYKSLVGRDMSLIPILPEVLARRTYHMLRSRMDKNEVANLVLSRLKNVTETRRGASDVAGDFQERFSDQLLSELSDDNNVAANTDEYLRNRQNYWTGPKSRQDTRRLYHASVTSIHEYPFMVSVHVANNFWCGGVLYWHDIVLTTASCLQLLHNNRFYRENPRALSVRIGSNVSRAGGEMVDAVEVYFYPGYKPETLSHNLAIIRLRYWVFFEAAIPKVIRLSRAKNPPSIQTEVLVLGWGAHELSGYLQGPGDLRYQYLPIYPNIYCTDVYNTLSFEYRTMFCAGTIDPGTGACNHDVGGAAIHQGKLLGLVSHGPTRCGMPNSPTIFTHMGYYEPWIRKINGSMPHYYRSTVRTTTTPNATTADRPPADEAPADEAPADEPAVVVADTPATEADTTTPEPPEPPE